MKRILIAISLICMTFAVQAQSRSLIPVSVTTTAYGNVLDTVDNTETHVTTAYRVSTWTRGITAQVVVTKISGTVAGTLGLQGSMDGTNWTLIGSATTPADTSATYSFNTIVAWYYYRTSWVGTGTMSASFKTFLLPY